jgi:cytochrome c-type biogenesis protein CcmH/NrfG
MTTDPVAAEATLVSALEADPFCGRGRNNLGVIYLAQGRLYDAAFEFEAARRLMPDNPDPRINLGLTFERAGRLDDAMDAYTTAHELNPDHLGAMQALARAQLRHGRAGVMTPMLLEEIALRGDPSWREWAVARLRGLY